jgi:UDP-3-O-[3-hydroxymyristoyl] glucosamine N-acyltransferase
MEQPRGEQIMKLTTVRELATLVDGSVVGDDTIEISGISTIEDSQSGDVTFAENARLLGTAARSLASAVIAPQNGPSIDKPLIRVKNPKFAFAQVLRIFAPEQKIYKGIHETAQIDPSAKLGENVSIHASSVVGENTLIGANTVIFPFVFVGDNVTIGPDCVIYPHVVLHDNTEIGKSVIIHSGSVLGTDGFGYMFIEDRHYKIPQIGRVIVGDDVEIGANVTIDKARTGSTRIGRGTKIDNLVHIGHNCTIGDHSVIVAQVGVSGSVQIGKGVILAGQAGIKDHVSIGDGAIVAAKTGVIGDVPAGRFVSGQYGRPHNEDLRSLASIKMMPKLMKNLKEMEKRVALLEAGKADS